MSVGLDSQAPPQIPNNTSVQARFPTQRANQRKSHNEAKPMTGEKGKEKQDE